MLDAELVGVTQSVPKYLCSGSGQWSKQSHQLAASISQILGHH